MKSSNQKKPSASKKTRRFRGWRRWLVIASLPVLLFMLAVFCIYAWRASRLDIRQVGQIPQRSFVYDVNGTLYSRLYGQNRVLVKLEDVSPKFIAALLAREDTRFYSHPGVDPRGIARAVVRNIVGGKMSEGASTLTQQLARNSFELGGKTLDRKVLEAFVAFRIESKFSKRQILENYINRIYYGGGYYGLEIASQAYFGKPSKDLTLGEAAMMAGLIRSPKRFSPLKDLAKAKRERDAVLNRMVLLKKISQPEADKAKQAPVVLNHSTKTVVQQNYVMDAVNQELQILLEPDQIDEGGMKIYTTINASLQKTAETALDNKLTEIENMPGYNHPTKAAFDSSGSKKTDYLQGAVVLIDNRSGGICALVGGRDRSHSDYNRALLGFRQIGSTIKPFVYATAFSKGLLPGAYIDDGPIQAGEVVEAANWRPGNSDGQSRGILSASDGLVLSRNTMTVRVGEFAGLENVKKTFGKAGISEAPDFPSIFLGAFETTPRNLTSAYTIFPNQGRRKQAYLIERIDDKLGNPVYRAAHIETKVIAPGAAWLTTNALEDVMTRGTAAKAKSLGFTKIAGGKTGTTNDYKDAWFVGFTSSLTCGVWVGLDKPEPIIAKGYGGTLALPIWIKVMNSASSKQYPDREFTPGIQLVATNTCRTSNALATSACQTAGTEYTLNLPADMIPKRTCSIHKGRAIFGYNPNSESGQDAAQTSEKPSLPNRILESFSKLFRGGK